MTAINTLMFCSAIFGVYLFLPRLIFAVTIFIVTYGYMAFAYTHYFQGGWEASGQKTPFNEELIFYMVVLVPVFSGLGFAAWLAHHRGGIFGKGFVAKLKVFGLGAVACAATSVILWVGLPLSFERPIDVTLCGDPATQPEYCP
ncbi:MAG: hypothetical protein AAFN51_10540 [Pseudomonadota bacterium]